ncbi:hypothetical protein BDB01DRAFT_786777 [Pilobolus umbonatus]|nr:hypothetical protein BDB01DRAFT_786777 [Pilobolus umbonatus]
MEREKKFVVSSDEGEMSDLDGDQVSDVEQEVTQEEEEDRPISKLPSFKKRNRDSNAEEEARLEEARREIRELKNNSIRERDDELEDDIPVDPQQALRDEIDREFAKALNSGKKKRKKQDGEDLENSMDEELATLREKMKTASEEDAISNNNRKAAISKLKMLNEVTTLLTNKHLHDAILDNGLLEAIRLWLEPLPDRSLPSLDIQNEMFNILDKLPIAGDHLRESGVGKIVYFYTKCPRIEPRMKRKADQLVAKWSRLVIKRSENYKERRHVVQEFRQEDMMHQRKKYRPPADNEEDRDGHRMHVRVPQAVAADYDIAPQSTVRIDKSRGSRPEGTFKRLNNKMRSIKTGPKRSTPKVSIEGKGMSF